MLRRTWRGWALAAAGEHAIRPDTPTDAPAAGPDEVAAVVRETLDHLGFPTTRVVAALSGHVFVKRLSVPAMSQRELADAVPWLADEHVPFDLAEVVLDYQVLDAAAGSSAPALELVLVAAKRERVAERTALIARAGRNAALLDVEAFALVNAYRMNYPERADGLEILLHVDRRNAVVSLLQEGQIVFTRDISVAGTTCGDEPREFCAQLVVDIRKTMDFYGATTPLGRFERLVVSGEAWNAEGLADRLTAEFDAPVEPFDAFRRVLCRGGAADRSVMAPAYAVAVGLAMRREGDAR